jgi:hypothetical protein
MKRNLSLLVLVALLGVMSLAACDGSAVIDVNMDPETGEGNIVVDADDDSGGGEVDVTGDGTSDVNMTQVALFGVIIALLLGTVAIVMSSSRRSREG